MRLTLVLLLPLLDVASAIVDCMHGFVGRIQSGTQHRYVNETRMCAADYCIKLIIRSGHARGSFRQGVASRCAFTSAERAACALQLEQADDDCSRHTHFDGLHGDLSLCCCSESRCNGVTGAGELLAVYASSSNGVSLPIVLISFMISVLMARR